MIKKLKISTATAIGKKTSNQDSYILDKYYLSSQSNFEAYSKKIFPHKEDLAFAVFDGIGGLNNGDVASDVLANFTQEHLTDLKRPKPKKLEWYEDEALFQFCDNATAEVKDQFEFGFTSGGTTFTAVILVNMKDGIQIRCLNVGDSPAYLLRNNTLTELTYEHTLAQYKREQNCEKISVTDENTLLNYMGCPQIKGYEQMYFNKEELYLTKGDVILICSDGISKGLSREEIIDVLSKSRAKKKAENLIYTVLKKDASYIDNMAAIVLSY